MTNDQVTIHLAGWSGRWESRLTASQSSHILEVLTHPYLARGWFPKQIPKKKTNPQKKKSSHLELASQYCTTVCTFTVSSMITWHWKPRQVSRWPGGKVGSRSGDQVIR